MSNGKNIFVPIGEFDASRLVLEEPQERKSRNGEFSWFTSRGYYKDDNGDNAELYFQLPEQFFFGFNANYPNGMKDQDKSIDVIEGIQICYLLTSMETIENPTKDEQYAIDTLQSIWQLIVDRMKEFCTDEDIVLPGVTESAYFNAEAKKDPTVAVKPPFSHPMKKEKGKNGKEKLVEDTTKPKRSYIKLETFDKGRKMKCNTLVHGPGDVTLNPLKYLDRRGRIVPVIRWGGVYYGGHGKRSWGASPTFRLSECNYIPQKRGGPPRRMLATNNAPRELLEDNETNFPSPTGDSEGEDEGFETDKTESQDEALLAAKKEKTKATKRPRKKPTRRRFVKKEKTDDDEEED